MQETLDRVESRESIEITNNGQKIFGILHRPTCCENPPIVVTMHGFASSKHGSNRCYVTLAENLAKAGIATLRFDFRGAGDSEGNLSELTFEDLISDALKMIDAVDRIEQVDAGRVGFFGASLGGAISILAQARAKRAKALALWAPVASGELWYRDFLTQNQAAATKNPSEILASYRGIKLNPEFRDQFAKMFAYKTIQELNDLPILHMHGKKDEIISIAHQQAFEKGCQMNSAARFITFADDQHALGFSPNFSKVIEECILFFKKNL